MSDQEPHDMTTCGHNDEPGAMPLAHVVQILRGLRSRIDERDLKPDEIKVLLGAFANSIQRTRAELIAADAADDIVAGFEGVLATAAQSEGGPDGG